MLDNFSEKLAFIKDLVGNIFFRALGLLFGAIIFALSSIVVLFFSSQFGYEYNFLLPLLGYLAGYLSGIIVELTYKAILLTRKD